MDQRVWRVSAVVMMLALIHTGTAQANLKDIKAYKEVYPNVKLKCTDCHMVVRGDDPDNPMDLNPYGKAAMLLEKFPTAERYRKIGRLEDFGKEPTAATETGVPAPVTAAAETPNVVTN